MTRSARYNGRIPTDPATLLILFLTLAYTVSQLTTDQVSALIATGGIAELAVLLTRLLPGRR